jgi:hypothetical protein
MRAFPLPSRAAAARGLPLVLGAFVLLDPRAAAHAQTATSNLRGYVRTPAGAPVPDAQVGARALATNATRGTVTNASGFYYLGGLRPGGYEITVRRVGFAPVTRTVQLQIGQTVDLNLQIAEAAVTLSTVTVEAQAGGSTARTSEVGSNISREQIQNLPNFERNVLDLARLVPGVTATAPNSTDKTIAAGGQPSEAVNVFVDGATYKNDVLRGGVVGQDASKGNPFPQGAIQEFRVITQNYKAEFQKAASAIITASTRSGTNEFEADGFAYGVGKSYVARDAFTANRGGPRPNYQRLQAGLNLGGPLVRDKLFAFGTYELNFRDEPAIIRLGADSVNLPAALRQQLSQFTGQEAQEFRQHLGFGKLTWIASDRSTVDVSTTIRRDEDFRGFGQRTAFSAAENLRINVYNGVANWRRAGDRWLNEAQVSGQYMTWNPTARDFSTIGRDYREILRIGGKDSNQEFEQARLSLRNDVTRAGVRLAGDHVFKGGVTVDVLSYTAVKNFNGNPVFAFRREEQYARPFEANFGFGDPDVSSDNVQFGGYVQDDWTVGRRLVLNLGLRWDAETNMINNDYVTPRPLADSLRGPLNGQLFVRQPVAGGGPRQVRVIDQLGGIDRYISNGRSSRPVYLRAFQPRVGASFDLFADGRTVLFGGAGVYYDRNYWNTLLDEQFRRQFAVLNVQFRGTAAECAASDRPATCTVWNDRFYDPAQLRTLSGSTGLPEVFLVANDLVPPRTTQLSGGLRQAVGTAQVTVSYNGVRGRNFMNFVRGAYELAPNYRAVFVTDDRVKTWYDALQLQVERPLRGLSRWGGAIAYTLSRSEEQGQSQELFWGFNEAFPTVGDLPRRRAPNDQRHTVVANTVVRLPLDFRVSAIGTFGSGIAVNATDATNGFGFGREVSYVFTPPGRPFLGVGRVFNTQTVDLRVEKEIALPGAQNVSLLADVFNAFNNANYGCYGDNATIVPRAEQNDAFRARYGQPNCGGLGRRLQVGLRYGYRASTFSGAGAGGTTRTR